MFQRSSLPESDIYHLLSNPRRRETLTVLLDRPGETHSVRALSEAIAASESGEWPAPRPLRESVYNALHQTHLPKMDRLGVVDYDNDRGTVTLTDHVEEFDIYLDVVASDDLPWSQFYLALGGVLTALVGVAALGVPPFSFVGGFGYALFVALAFVTVAGFHTLRDRRSLVGTTDAPPEVCPPPKEATGNWADD